MVKGMDETQAIQLLVRKLRTNFYAVFLDKGTGKSLVLEQLQFNYSALVAYKILQLFQY